ncbi:hypothetical protein Q4561_03835 [Alteromonas sp. 1_MG-2023]|uniref:hypothetical protein n=1 Tax=Alteromonas sp. 1_MG-2023 TaxID=3062669 RepID=UPI0026E456BB|nr:hypothetical protein [Alteromonas sp. 1_MG-2023]MDO6566179.1 hypothetical protein [Alteromonas sp. 1_MG-2023]
MLNHLESERNTHNHSASHSAYTAFKRLIHTIIMATAVALAVGLFLMYQQYQTHWVDVQTAQPGTSISKQYSKILQPALIAQDTLQLERLIAIALDEPAVISLSVFDAQGVYIAPLPKVDSVVSLARERNAPTSTHVEKIIDDAGKVIGYLHVHIDTDVVLSSPLTLRQQLWLIITAVVVLALIVGVYITRGFYKFRPWITKVFQS